MTDVFDETMDDEMTAHEEVAPVLKKSRKTPEERVQGNVDRALGELEKAGGMLFRAKKAQHLSEIQKHIESLTAFRAKL